MVRQSVWGGKKKKRRKFRAYKGFYNPVFDAGGTAKKPRRRRGNRKNQNILGW